MFIFVWIHTVAQRRESQSAEPWFEPRTFFAAARRANHLVTPHPNLAGPYPHLVTPHPNLAGPHPNWAGQQPPLSYAPNLAGPHPNLAGPHPPLTYATPPTKLDHTLHLVTPHPNLVGPHPTRHASSSNHLSWYFLLSGIAIEHCFRKWQNCNIYFTILRVSCQQSVSAYR